jgi:hypothetical protein
MVVMVDSLSPLSGGTSRRGILCGCVPLVLSQGFFLMGVTVDKYHYNVRLSLAGPVAARGGQVDSGVEW